MLLVLLSLVLVLLVSGSDTVDGGGDDKDEVMVSVGTGEVKLLRCIAGKGEYVSASKEAISYPAVGRAPDIDMSA